VLPGGEIIVMESNAPPGATRRVSELIAARRQDLHLPHVPDVSRTCTSHCPERGLSGRIMIEIVTNDRSECDRQPRVLIPQEMAPT
jgi:UDP-N-acetyl-D-mannosaminuronic acid dehydrogenase